jgi:hypothetical protein
VILTELPTCMQHLFAMRRSWIVVTVIACSAPPAAPPAAPRGPTACERASDSMVLAMLARLPAGARTPTEEADAMRNLIRERCERDGWSAEATQCLTAMKQREDAAPCAKLLSEDDQAALVRDLEAQLAASQAQPAQPGGSGAPSPAGSGAPSPAGSDPPSPAGSGAPSPAGSGAPSPN